MTHDHDVIYNYFKRSVTIPVVTSLLVVLFEKLFAIVNRVAISVAIKVSRSYFCWKFSKRPQSATTWLPRFYLYIFEIGMIIAFK